MTQRSGIKFFFGFIGMLSLGFAVLVVVGLYEERITSGTTVSAGVSSDPSFASSR